MRSRQIVSGFVAQIGYSENLGNFIVLNDPREQDETIFFVCMDEDKERNEWSCCQHSKSRGVVKSVKYTEAVRGLSDGLFQCKEEWENPEDAQHLISEAFSAGMLLCLLDYLNQYASCHNIETVKRALTKALDTHPESILRNMQRLTNGHIDIMSLYESADLKLASHSIKVTNN